MTKFWIRLICSASFCAVVAWCLPGERAIVPVAAAGSCEALASLQLPGATITLAQPVTAGGFVQPGANANQGTAAARLQPFCRVAATLKPSADSDIKMELWMPAANWNGKYQAVGNGAFNGTINYGAMMTALARGYATSSTDTGHVGPGASFALGHPEKVIDFGWRAVHEMTVASKKIIESHYGGGPKYSYWNGCSAGGRQAMKAAQRFPADFDGIIAGAPGLDWTGRAASALRIAKPLERSEAARLTQPKRELLHTAVLNACDLSDGVKDGVIENPASCTFDPGVLECKGADGPSCLTREQVGTARSIYAAALNRSTKREITGLERGSELGWTDLGWTASARATGLDQFRYIVYGDPNWNIERFNFESDIVRAEEVDNDTINALNPNLKPFLDRGGKLIQYHGWADPQISPASSTQYYASVVQALGGAAKVHDSYRLFMAPGMGHCGGGAGPNTFDMVSALESWVEQGKAPDAIVASRSAGGAVEKTRPLCPYPQVATYKGSGSTNDAASFACATPARAQGR
jgi:feruloyl esterase